MRTCLASAAVLAALASSAAAADLPAAAAGGPVPYRARPVAAAVRVVARPPLPFAYSRFTGQPITVIFNEPGRTPWSVRPGLELLPLLPAKPFHTRGVYPRGS